VYGRLFTLVTIDDDSKIFAWGIEIDTDVDGVRDTEAIIYRKDPATGQTLFGLHDSAESASDRWSSIVPVEVNWEDSYSRSSASAMATSAIPASPTGSRPRPLVTV
jgi:hypothetical protein